MSITLGLRIGESFAELVASRGSQIAFHQRWYLPKLSLTEGLRAALQSASPAFTKEELSSKKNRLIFSSSRAAQILRRRQGEAPAFLTTSGFETRLSFQSPVTTPAFAAQAARGWVPFDTRRTFGIRERILADGKILKALEIEELAEITAKLELLKIKSVAIGFVHCTQNPIHELQAANYLREKGFRVVTSHGEGQCPLEKGNKKDLDESSEGERWMRALEEAYVVEPLSEDLKAIDQAFRDVLMEDHASWAIQIWSATGPIDFDIESESHRAHDLKKGFHTSLEEWAKSCPQSVVLHLGLEGFFAFGTAQAQPSVGAHPHYLKRSLELPVHATNTVEIGDWSVPRFSDAAKGFEPGPMIFGKAHHLTPIDLLSICGHLKTSDEITELIHEKSASRILEALFTFGKMIPTESDKVSVDAQDVAQALETAWIETIVATVSRLAPRSVRVTGALAQSLLPLLAKRRPDWSFAMGQESEFAEAFAAARLPMTTAITTTTAKNVAQPADPSLGLKANAKALSKTHSKSATAATSRSVQSANTQISSVTQKTVTRAGVKTVTRGGTSK